MKFKKYSIFSLASLMLASTLFTEGGSLQAQALSLAQPQIGVYKNGALQGQILIKLKADPETVSEVRRVVANSIVTRTAGGQREALQFNAMPRLSQISNQIRAIDIAPLFVVNPKFEARFKAEGLDRWFIIEFESEESPYAIMEAMKASGELETVDINAELAQPQYKSKPFIVSPANAFAAKATTSVVDDPMFDKQWHYQNNGQTGGTPGADISLVKAWERRMNAENVIVAVMDQGVDHQHEDIHANMWVNEAELYGRAGFDDDGNGLIDDIYGFDFGNGYGQIEKGDHGTHVAGTVAAVSNNGIGVAGIAGGDGSGNGARIMTLPVFGSNNARAANSFIYAADNGALISQNSWGFTTPGYVSESWQDAIRYFIKYAGCDANGDVLPGSLMKGGVAIFASGNSSSMGAYFPACMPEVISVVALNHLNRPANYTNYDSWVTLASYGGETSINQNLGVLSTIPNNQYGYMDGTSMACPHVAGVACLALAEHGGVGFTNEMLWNYLTLTTRNNDANYEPQYAGRMGVGISDALNALIKKDGVPPHKIEQTAIRTIADTYCHVSFQAPSKVDNGKVEGYKVSITETASGINKVLTFSAAKMPGEEELLFISDLKKGTNYTVDVTSYDIWLEHSPASDPITFTTALEKGVLGARQLLYTRTLDYKQTSSVTYDVTIQNNGAGALFWRADTYAKGHEDKAQFFLSQGTTGTLTRIPMVITSSEESELEEQYKTQGYKQWITYRQAVHATRYIGETRENGVTFPASAAVKFTVPADMKEGFTLTHFDVGLRTNLFWLNDDQATTNKQYLVGFEIYRGEELPKIENRIYHIAIHRDPLFELDLYELPYSPHFEVGETFWIVTHAERGLRYPLGITYDATAADRSYYSSDSGATWTSLDRLFVGETPSFVMGALSKRTTGLTPMRLAPASGYLEKGESKNIQVTIDATEIREGNDTTHIVLSTDGTLAQGRNIITSVLELKRDDVKTAFDKELYDYSTVSLGDSKDYRVSIRNKGMGHMPIDSIVVSNKAVFEIVTKTLPKTLYANDSILVDVRFKPTKLGAANTQLKIYGRNRVDSVLLIGTCVEPPTAVVSPLVIDRQIKGNTKFVESISIANTSNYSLSYGFPEFLDALRPMRKLEVSEFDDIEGVYKDSLDLYAGYRWVDNLRTPSYQGSPWVEISETGTELTRLVDHEIKNTKITLPFGFPYYDRVVRELWVGVNGTLVLDSTNFGAFNVPVLLPDYEGEINEVSYKGMIAPLWMSDGTGANFSKTRFFYQVLDDCILFQFQGTIVETILSDRPSIYQCALYPNGEIEFRYKQTFEIPTWTSNSFLVGWASPDGLDGRTIFYMHKAWGEIGNTGNYAIRIYPPDLSPFYGEEGVTYKGLVNPTAAKQVSFGIDPSKLPAGKSSRNLVIETNDPENKEINILFNFDKEDEPEFNFQDEAVNYGALLYNTPIAKEINIFNAAYSDADVKLQFEEGANISFANGAKELTLRIKANSTGKFSIYLSGAVDTKIIASSTDGSIRFDEIAIKSQRSIYENITAALLSKKSFSFNLEAGSSASETVRITADAQAYSSKVFLPGFMYIEQAGAQATAASATNGIDNSGYRWYNSEDPEAPQFIWNDISRTGTRLALEPHLDNPVIELPFSYSFYGVESTELYVSPSGRISYVPLPWDVFDAYRSARRMPSKDLDIPFISGMWGRQWYSSTNREAGVFYDVTEDRCIVQFHMFQYDWVITKGYCSYQIVLHKDGTIQFVYLDIERCDLKEFVTIGMQGEGGSDTKGYTYSLTSSTPIKNRTTVTAKPMYGPYTIEANQSIDLLLTANSYGFKAGSYDDQIIFVSENNQLQTSVPVQMQVSSNAKLQLKETEIDFGSVIAGENVEAQIFTLINGGNLDLEISEIRFTGESAKNFEVKYKELVLDDHGDFSELFHPLEYPVRLPVYGSESYYVYFTPDNENRDYLSEMEFVTTDNQPNDKITIKARSLKPAKLAIQTLAGASLMNVDLASTNGPTYDKLNVVYEEGEVVVDYELQYEVVNPLLSSAKKARVLNPVGRKFEVSAPVYLHRTALETAVVQRMEPMPISSVSMEPYRDISVIGDIAPTAMIGPADLGEHFGLSAFVKMNTDDTGFLMSHLKMWTNSIGRDTGYLEIRIYEDCPQPTREHLIYEKAHRYKMNVPVVGELTLPLEHDIAFAPNQEFWVEVYFGIKLEMPIAVANRPESMTELRNFYRLYNAIKDEWEPIQEYPNTLFAIWAVQESYSNLTKWFSISSDDNTIAPQEQNEADVRFNRLHIPVGGANVRVKAKTEQLSNVTPLHLNVTKYKEPEWMQFPTKPLIVREGSEVSFFVKAEDNEGLSIQYSLSSPVVGVTLTAVDGGAQVVYQAPYTAGYVANINIEARTSKGVSVRRVSIGNINVNRAPIANAIKPITLSLDRFNSSTVFPTYYFFVDPDNDYMEYGGSVNGNNIALNLNQNGFIFTPVSEGMCDVVLHAYDGEFSVSNKFTVNVITPLVYAPILKTPFPNRSVTTGQSFSVDLDNHFADLGGYELTFEAWSTDLNIGIATVSGSTLSVVTFNPGIAAIGITARNSEGAETMASFAYQAIGAAPDNTPTKALVSIAPNPVRNVGVVSFSMEEPLEGDYTYEVRDMAGRQLRAERLNAVTEGEYSASLSVEGIKSGVYILTVYKNGELVATEKLVVAE